MQKKVVAIFDIGRTNKKFFLFDMDFREVHREYTTIDEIVDEDDYPTENLEALERWAKTVFNRALGLPEFDVVALNFSCYGASLVHLDANGKTTAPLYNYLKPIEEEITTSFYKKYGPEAELSRTTGSIKLGMLNTGMQLYWLKHTRPETFKKVSYSLHLPQYMSYIFTGRTASEYTSIGCHTMLWDYGKRDYHAWVYKEEIYKVLPPIVPAETSFYIGHKGLSIKIGVGIHDSSAALLPYLESAKKKFILVSTGTWSIALNPYITRSLTDTDVEKDCMNYMRINGDPVRASRLLLGNEYELQVAFLSSKYQVPDDYHKTVTYNEDVHYEITKDFQPMFKWLIMSNKNMGSETELPYRQFEHAYHQLMVELVLLQVESITDVSANDQIGTLYIDGGFGNNDVFVKLLSYYLKNMEVSTADSSLGSALGAALVIAETKPDSNFLENNYGLRNIVR